MIQKSLIKRLFWDGECCGLLGADWSHLGCPWHSRKKKKKGWPYWLSCLEIRDIFSNAVAGFWKMLFSAGEWRLPVEAPETFLYPPYFSERSEHICFASSVLLRFLQVIPVPFILSKVDFSLYPQIFSEECYTISQMIRYNSFLHKILWVFKDEKRISSTVSTLQSFLRPRPLQGNDRSIQT